MSQSPRAAPESHPFAVLYKAWADAPAPNGFDYLVPLKDAAKAWRVAANGDADDRLLAYVGGEIALAVAEDKPHARVMKPQWEQLKDVLYRQANAAVLLSGLRGEYDAHDSSASQAP